jgi:hypothetical protein
MTSEIEKLLKGKSLWVVWIKTIHR